MLPYLFLISLDNKQPNVESLYATHTNEILFYKPRQCNLWVNFPSFLPEYSLFPRRTRRRKKKKKKKKKKMIIIIIIMRIR
jgi:hypothetical protein